LLPTYHIKYNCQVLGGMMSKQVWQFLITDNMIEHLDMNELSLFINSLEDSIQDICSNYDVEPWEMSNVD